MVGWFFTEKENSLQEDSQDRIIKITVILCQHIKNIKPIRESSENKKLTFTCKHMRREIIGEGGNQGYNSQYIVH